MSKLEIILYDNIIAFFLQQKQDIPGTTTRGSRKDYRVAVIVLNVDVIILITENPLLMST